MYFLNEQMHEQKQAIRNLNEHSKGFHKNVMIVVKYFSFAIKTLNYYKTYFIKPYPQKEKLTT